MLLTAAPDAAWRLRGPVPGAGAEDGGGSICGVAGLTAIGQQGAQGERPPVGFGLVQQVSVLHAGGPRTTCSHTETRGDDENG